MEQTLPTITLHHLWKDGTLLLVEDSACLSTSIVSLDNENYHRWTTNSIVLGADGGGNASIGYTFVPFVW